MVETGATSTATSSSGDSEDWIGSLARRLRAQRWPGPLVPLSVAVDELREWASSAQIESWERKANRGSLSQDLATATDRLGDNLRRLTLVEADALVELVRMATVSRPTRQTLGKIRDCADSLKHKLDDRDSIEAAWRDVIASSRGSDVQALDNQILILEDLIERSGGQSLWVFPNVAAAISGSDQFGRFFSPDTSRMSLPERLELAEDPASRRRASRRVRSVDFLRFGPT